ncbi:MAG: 1-phosphofructokinase family hexose kinase [Methylohalobius sp.]
MPVATLTLNPAVDVTYEIGKLICNQKVRAKTSRFDPGGNGINVGRALKRLGIAASNFCVLAGETGAFLERLLARHLDDPVYVWVEGETRINATILEQETGAQYEVTGQGPYLPKAVLEGLGERFVGQVGSGYGVVTGSVPPGVAEDAYAAFIRQIQSQGGRAVLDAHGGLLKEGVAAGPFLVKPNRYELEQLSGRPLPDLPSVLSEAEKILAQGVAYVCVSLGKDGALLVGREARFLAAPPQVNVLSSVGAGDSLVAGLVAGFVRGLELPEVLRLAVAVSVGTVRQPGTELFLPEELPQLLEQVQVRRL